MASTAGQSRHRLPSLEARIEAHYTTLPDSERKLADVIMDFPGELSAYSATELADKAGVSKAAASRLFKRLGFTNFEEARRLVRDTRDWGSPLYLQGMEAGLAMDASDLQDSVDDAQQLLARTFDGVDPSDLDNAVAALLAGEHLWLVGFRNSYFMAAYARWQFIQFRRNVALLPGPGETLGEYLAELGPDDVLLVVGFKRRVSQVRRIMEAARRAGARIIYLTDQTTDGIHEHATWTFVCDISSRHPFHNYVAPLALLHYLGVHAMRRAGRAGRLRLERIEVAHERLQEFD